MPSNPSPTRVERARAFLENEHTVGDCDCLDAVCEHDVAAFADAECRAEGARVLEEIAEEIKAALTAKLPHGLKSEVTDAAMTAILRHIEAKAAALATGE